MIVFRYLNREVLRSFAGILTVLMAIFLSQRLVGYLGAAAGGELSGVVVLKLVTLYLPVLFSLLLPLTLFLAILLALGRLYAEQEMTVLRACGVGEQDVLHHLLRPVLWMTAFTAALTLYVMPVALESQYQVLDQQSAESELSLLSPGRFQETQDKRSVLYVEEFGEANALGAVFFATMPEKETESAGILAAQAGHHWLDERDGQRYLVLENGYRYELTPGTNKWTVVKYDKYFMRLQPRSVQEMRRKAKALSTWQLLQDLKPEHVAELQWRLSVPLSMPILTLLAVPLCRVRPREGKFAKILPGLLLYLGYTMLLMVARSSIEEGKLTGWVGMWPIHAIAFVIGFWSIRRREIRRAPQTAGSV